MHLILPDLFKTNFNFYDEKKKRESKAVHLTRQKYSHTLNSMEVRKSRAANQIKQKIKLNHTIAVLIEQINKKVNEIANAIKSKPTTVLNF